MVKKTTLVDDKTCVVDGEGSFSKINNSELHDTLTLENKLENYNCRIDELRLRYDMLCKKNLRYYKRLILYLIIYFALCIYFPIIYHYLFSLLLVCVLGVFIYEGYKIDNDITNIKRYIANIEDDYFKISDELYSRYCNLNINSDNISLYFDDCLVNREEYDNIEDVGIETDFSQDYDKISKDIKVRRREKKSGNIGERR